MQKIRSLILLVLLSAVILTPLKAPSCPKQNSHAPVALSSLSASTTSLKTISSCSSVSSWLSEKEYEVFPGHLNVLIGLLFFLLVFSKYSTPFYSIYRPPIRF